MNTQVRHTEVIREKEASQRERPKHNNGGGAQDEPTTHLYYRSSKLPKTGWWESSDNITNLSQRGSWSDETDQSDSALDKFKTYLVSSSNAKQAGTSASELQVLIKPLRPAAARQP